MRNWRVPTVFPCLPVFPILDLAHPSVDEYHSKLLNLACLGNRPWHHHLGSWFVKMPFISSQISTTYIFGHQNFPEIFGGSRPFAFLFVATLLGEIWLFRGLVPIQPLTSPVPSKMEANGWIHQGLRVKYIAFPSWLPSYRRLAPS